MQHDRWFRQILGLAMAGGTALLCAVGCEFAAAVAYCKGDVGTCSFYSDCVKGSERYGCHFGPTCASSCEVQYQKDYDSFQQCATNSDCTWDADSSPCYGVPAVKSRFDVPNSECYKVPDCTAQGG